MHRVTSTSKDLSLENRRFQHLVICLILVMLGASTAGASQTATATSLSVTPATSVTEGTALTLQAGVTTTGPVPVTRGSVTFYDGSRVLSVVELVYNESVFTTGTANFQLFLGPGSHVLKAVYDGTSTYQPSASSTTTVTVTMPSSAVMTTVITSSGSAGSYTLMGKVTAFSSTAATGLVSFTDQTKSNFSLGTATLDSTTLTSGWQAFTASATPNPNYAILMGDLNGDGIPALSPVTYGIAPLTLTATASSELPVTFSVISGPATVSGTTLTVTGAGNVVIQADQAGDSNYQAAPPVQRTLAVSKAASNLALITSAASVNANVNVTLTATVTSSDLPAPPGSAVFLDGSTQLATVAFNGSGVATYSITSLAAETHSITATYSGSTNFLSSSSGAVTETVVASDYSVAANPATLTIQRGNAGNSVLTITPRGGFTGQVAFTCTGLPQYASCSFTPATVTLAGDDAAHTVQFSVSTVPTPIVANFPTLAFWSPFGILALLSLTRRGRLVTKPLQARGAQLVGLAGLLLGIAACSGSSPNQVPLGTSTVTMTAATVGGNTRHAATITITQ